ncbi:TRAP transporter, DctM subunit [Paracoccus halophilus]|uniref:TRAP transporter large permease protein n=1 Tax=Paracoccus halophilus TaxID=376733 RepID=A0A099EXA0_9RHOB|nr:TRAP transporter large permease [Paracoccus halophilus]KGJ03025.1 C4-dicarboxylate ABC transporter permease [Paracoccus halophilus]SFA50398.1 TRAP transporter, DctM subunit [Paracoccus halophilus]
MIWLLIVIGLTVFALGGIPLGAALAGVGLILYHFFAGGGGNMALAFEGVWSTFNNFTFSSIILFVLVGDLFFAGGLSKKSYGALAPLFRRIPGKLLHTNVVVCMLFGAVSGTSSATAAAIGAAAYPELERRNYHAGTVVGSLAASGTLGLLIPPSLALILFGAMTDNSIGRLFLAGVLPGILLGLGFMALIAIKSRLRPEIVPVETEIPGWGEAILALFDLWPLFILMFAVLGPLYSGLATPTESAAVGFVFVLLLGFTVGGLTLRNLGPILVSTMVKYGAIALVVIGAVVLKNAVAILGLPRDLIEAAANSGLGRYAVFALIVLAYLILGCLFDGISLLLLTVPFIAPMLIGQGFDPIWLGVMVTVLIEIGMITPPVGPNLFILSTISGNRVSVGEAARETLPYWLLLLAGIAFFTMFPGVVTWLPDLVYGGL